MTRAEQNAWDLYASAALEGLIVLNGLALIGDDYRADADGEQAPGDCEIVPLAARYATMMVEERRRITEDAPRA